jgi:hypothetical protein
VPEHWTVYAKVYPLFGGYEDRTRSPRVETTERLVISGLVIMGGVEVVN